MKKWTKPTDCRTCMANGISCYVWTCECGSKEGACGAGLSKRIGRMDYYANKEETEAILNWHNEKRGTIQTRLEQEKEGILTRFGYINGEWMAVEAIKGGKEKTETMKKWNSVMSDCGTCFGMQYPNCQTCAEWQKELKGSACHRLKYRYYANFDQVKSLLDYHNKKYGTIQDRLMYEASGNIIKFGYVNGEWKCIDRELKESETMGDCDFRVGDPVYSLQYGNGEVTAISDCMDDNFPVFVRFDTSKVRICFSFDGRILHSTKRSLFHGNDLEVTVEEKKPVRTVEQWMIVLFGNGAGNMISPLFSSEEEAITTAHNMKPEWTKIHGPVKVQIPV